MMLGSALGEIPLEYSASAATGILTAVAGSMMTVTGIVFSVLTLTVQHAGAAVSPRVVKTFYRDRVVKYSLGFFVGTFTYSLLMISDIEGPAGPAGMLVGLVLVLVATGVFLYMINHVGQSLRSASMLRRVSMATQRAIRLAFVSSKRLGRPDEAVSEEPEHVTNHLGHPGVILAINRKALQRLARRRHTPFRLLVQAGDPLAPGDPMVATDVELSAWTRRRIRNLIAIGEERTIDYDPAFGIRILVDAGCKALSPGVNDPTTAVAALDHIALALLELGQLDLEPAGREWVVGERLSWDALLELALTEITFFGGSSFQVTRRLVALLDQLAAQLPESRHPAIEHQRAILMRRIAASHADPEDAEFAATSDEQGLSAAVR